MIALIKVELTRLRWRRAVLALVAAALLTPLLIALSAAWNTRPVTDAELQRAQAQAERDAEQPYVAQDIARCERNPDEYLDSGIPDADVAEACAELLAPRAEHYLWRSTLDVSSLIDNDAAAVVAIVAAIMLVIGTTFVGHDWNTGSMSNQLLFEPRRLRVWTAKAVAVALLAAVVAVVALLLFWAVIWVFAAQRDIDTSAAVWRDVRLTSLRAVGLLVGAGLAGYAFTMLFRSTVATLAIAFVVFAGGSVVLLSVLGEARAMPWLLPTNALAVLNDGTEYHVWSMDCEQMMPRPDGTFLDDSDPCTGEISAGRGATYLGVLLSVSIALSVASFRRRDLP